MFNLGDKVLVDFRDNKHPAIIIDIEQCEDYDHRTRQILPPVFTGRYGVEFINENPTIIDKPYFWSDEITLASD